MACSINASTSGAGGVITTADNSGILNLQAGSTTVATVSTSGFTLPTGFKGTGSSAGILGGVVMSYHQERTGVGAITGTYSTYYPMAWGNGNGGNKGILMPFAGKLVYATLIGQAVTGTVTVQAGVNGTTNASYQLTATGTGSQISATGDFRSSPLSFAAGTSLGWFQLAAPSAADGFQVAFWIVFD